MQIPNIKTTEDDLQQLVSDINSRIDQITREFNSINTLNDEKKDQAVKTNKSGLTIGTAVSGKYYRFGQMISANSPNRSMFVDDADGLLKWKDANGILTVLT